jgi:hypothetical protein
MKKTRKPDKADVEAIREQILHFACDKHSFTLERDSLLPAGDWIAELTVTCRDHPEVDRLHCEAPVGEHYLRLALDLTVDATTWETASETILQTVAEHDIALHPSPEQGEAGAKHFRLYARAWTPGFSQRIFGLTFSNLVACKAAVLSMLSVK